MLKTKLATRPSWRPYYEIVGFVDTTSDQICAEYIHFFFQKRYNQDLPQRHLPPLHSIRKDWISVHLVEYLVIIQNTCVEEEETCHGYQHHTHFVYLAADRLCSILNAFIMFHLIVFVSYNNLCHSIFCELGYE